MNSVSHFDLTQNPNGRLGKPFPPRVILAGIGYRISEHEGLVVFSEDITCYGLHTRICFVRNCADMWELANLDGTASFDRIPMAHIEQAWAFVKAYRAEKRDTPCKNT